MPEVDLLFLSLFFLLGFGASFLGAQIGLGGGFLIVPLANLLFGIPFKDSVFLSLCAIFFVSLYHNHLNREVLKQHRKMLLQLMGFAVVGGVLSSFLAYHLSSQFLENLLGISLVAFGAYYFFDPKAAHPEDRALPVTSLVRAVSFCTGILAGLFGIGGGTIAVPALNKLLGFSLAIATKLSFFFILVPSLSALLTQFHLRREEIQMIPPMLVLVLTTGVIAGAYISRRRVKLSNANIKQLFSICLIGIGLTRLIL